VNKEEAAFATFLAERLAETWSAARDAELTRNLDESPQTRTADAMREILSHCTAALRYPANVPLANLARHVMADLGTIWDGHPDYREGWKPDQWVRANL